MIHDLSRDIALEISELYIFYINMTHSINTDEDLLKFIHTRLTDMCINIVSNYNKSSI